jgi:hypothetical protein
MIAVRRGVWQEDAWRQQTVTVLLPFFDVTAIAGQWVEGSVLVVKRYTKMIWRR